jgi:hypothetical protein
MEQTKVLIRLPIALKAQLEALRPQGYTINGFIRSLLEREFKKGAVMHGTINTGALQAREYLVDDVPGWCRYSAL